MTEDFTTIKDYDNHFISAVYDHDKEKDRKLKRRKSTRHIYNRRYKIAEKAKNTYCYEGYWIKDTSFKREYIKTVSEYIEPVYKRVWGKYPISNYSYRIQELLENDKISDLPMTDWNYEDVLIGYEKKIYSSNKLINIVEIPLEHPILKRDKWGNSNSNFDCTRNLEILADIGTAPGNYKKINNKRRIKRWDI